MGELRPTIVRARLQPRLLATGALEDLYIAGGGDRAAYRFGSQDYKAGLANLPRFKSRFGWDEDGWTGGVVPTTGELNWSPSRPADYKTYASNYHWKDAPILVEVGEEGEDGAAPASWTTVITGAVAGIAAEDGFIAFTIADLSAKLDKPVAASRFAGTGGIEGPTEAKTRSKRRSWGKVFNVECRILDKVNSIWEFGDPAFQSASVEDVRDMGRSASPAASVLAWQGSIAATFAALQASVPVPGSGVVAPSIQCLKWWTTPVGPLAVDITGEGGATVSAPYLAQAILASLGLGVTITDAERNAAHTLRPDDAGIHVGDDRLTIAQSLDQLLLGTSMLWVLNPSGAVNLRAISLSGPVETLTSLQVSRTKVLPPTKTRRVGYKKNNREHGDGEISAVLETGTDVIGGGGSNELLDTQFGVSWSLTAGVSRGDKNATGGYAAGNEEHYLEVQPSTTTQRDATSGKVAIQGGQRIFFEASVQRGTSLGSGSQLLIFGEWFNAAGTSLGTLTGKTVVAGDVSAGAIPKVFSFSEVSPATATHVRYKVRSPALASSSGTFRVEAPKISLVGSTAEITGTSAKVVKYDYTVTALSGELPTDLAYNFKLNNVGQTAGVAWTYLVQNGGVNGFDFDDGAQAMSGTGVGTLTVSSVETDTATVKITAVAGSYSDDFILTLTRDIAAAPPPGGGGGAETIASGSVSGTTSSSTFADKSGSITGTMTAAKTTARIVANLQNTIDSIIANQTETVEWKLERNVSGVWTQVGSSVFSTARERMVDFETGQWGVTDGNVTLDISDTGRTAGVAYSWRISARRSGGSHANYLSGTVTITTP